LLDELAKLDENQKDAALYLDNALVIAGAGSGKTTTIIAKLNYLIKMKHYLPEEILVISFTNESVNDLKKKIHYNMDVKTFHKLAIDLIDEPNIKIAAESYLEYIINEYFSSYAKENRQIERIIKKLSRTTTEDNIKRLIKTFINLYKANKTGIRPLFRIYQRAFFTNRAYLRIILDIYLVYLRELEASGLLDFNDMITHTTTLVKNNKIKTKYKFIVIDEFQDTSLTRFKLILSILEQNNGKIFVVGDDYQSIYRFSGCDLAIFLNMKKYVPNIKRLFLKHNYRNNQSLVNVANQFILRNKYQIKKNTVCHKDTEKPIVICFYVDKEAVMHKISDFINGKILVLGRNNRDKEQFKVVEDDRIRFLTIHRAKGLEEDNVILVNLENWHLGFPSQIKNEKLIAKVLKKDYLIYEEERRLMYVALTRTRNKIYLLVPKNNYSVFIKELIWKHKKNLEFIEVD